MTFDVTTLNEEERHALLFGILLGDGCLSYYRGKAGKNYYAIIITGNYYDDKSFFELVLAPLIHSFTGRVPLIKERLQYGSREILFCHKELFHKFSLMGFTIGKKKDIHIPEKYDGFLMKYLVQGLFATDGSLTLVNNNGTLYPRLFFTAALPSAFEVIASYLNSLGIRSGFYSAKRVHITEHDFKKTKTQYVICANGSDNLEKFRTHIGFLNPKQEKKYQEYLSRKSLAIPRIELGTPSL